MSICGVRISKYARGSGLGVRSDRQHTIGRENRRLGQLSVSSFCGFVIDPLPVPDWFRWSARKVTRRAAKKNTGERTLISVNAASEVIVSWRVCEGKPSFWLRADELAFTYRDVREKAGGKFGGVYTFAERRIAFVARD